VSGKVVRRRVHQLFKDLAAALHYPAGPTPCPEAPPQDAA
jgi:hypothetical protein